jgi:proteasome lid subunit RPN8/RPN11
LPAHVAVDWRDPANPTRKATPRNPGPTASVRADGGPEVTALLPELRATTGAWQGIVAEAAAQYPNEACGFVVRQANGQLESVAAPNLQDRYHALDPAAYPRTARTAYKLNERLIAKAQDAGATLVCIWHSHCDAGAYFSGEDVRCAAPDGQELYPGVRWLVVSVLGGKVANAAMYVFAPEVGEFFAE